MKAAIVPRNSSIKPCVVFWTGQVSLLKVCVVTWCGERYPAGEGVHQLPDDGEWCVDCEAAIRDKRYPKLG